MAISKKWWVVLAMALAQTTMFIDQTAIGIAQPFIQKSLNLSTKTLIWVPNIFFLAMAIFISLGGRLGDYLQYKRAFLLGITIFCLASFSAALFSDHITLLLIFRFVQGMGMAITVPNAVVIIIRSFPSENKGKGMGIFLGLSLFIFPFGLFSATSLMEHWDWRILFWEDVVLSLISGLLAYYAVVDPKLSAPEKWVLDWQGLITYTIAAASIVYLLMEYPRLNWLTIIILCASAIIFMLLCYYLEKKQTLPMIDFNLFKNKLFLSAIVLAFAITITVSLYVFDTLYYEQVLGYGPLLASVLFIPNIICQIVCYPIGGLLYDKLGYERPIKIGLICTIIGLLLNSWMVYYHIYWLLIPGILLINIGTPFIIASARTLGVSAVEKNEQGIASGLYNIFDILGATVTLALLSLAVISTYHYLLQNFLTKFHDLYGFLSLHEFEKILSHVQDYTRELTAQQSEHLIGTAKSSFTTGYSVGLLFCAFILFLALIYVTLLFKQVKTRRS